MNLLALNLRILVNPPLQDLQLDRNRAIGLDITHEWSETGFLREYFVKTCKNRKKPGFFGGTGGQKPGFC
jgi:hypothetical protein